MRTLIDEIYVNFLETTKYSRRIIFKKTEVIFPQFWDNVSSKSGIVSSEGWDMATEKSPQS